MFPQTLSLFRKFRALEDQLCQSVEGDIFKIQTLCRCMARYAAKNLVVPEMEDLPRRLLVRIQANWYMTLSERIEDILQPPSPKGAKSIDYIPRMEDLRDIPEVDEAQRRSRLDKYIAQWGFPDVDPVFTQGPKARPIMVMGLGRFESARSLAQYLDCRRSDVRNALKKGAKCRGYAMEYIAGEEPKYITRRHVAPVELTAAQRLAGRIVDQLAFGFAQDDQPKKKTHSVHREQKSGGYEQLPLFELAGAA